MTGGRVKRIKHYLNPDEPFFLTYGDGVADVDIQALLNYHTKHGKLATLTGIQPEGRFGILDFDGDKVQSFREKRVADTGWINGGFMVLNPKVLDYIAGDETMFEREPLEAIAAEGQLMCYRHEGFWKCMDTLRDKEALEQQFQSGSAPWINWNDEN